MPQEFIIDVELFQKYCSEPKCKEIFEVAISKFKAGEDNYVLKEGHCIIELLYAITYMKCVLAFSQQIKDEYLACFSKMPDDVVGTLESILSNSKKVKKVNPEEESSFINDDFQKIKSSQLRNKKIYLDAAKCLDERIIVCTKDELLNIYKPNSNLLMACETHARCVCHQWNEAKKC